MATNDTLTPVQDHRSTSDRAEPDGPDQDPRGPGPDDIQPAEHETLVDVLRWGNPVTPPIEALRAPLWEGALPSLADTVYLGVVGLASLALGAWVFGRVDDRIAAEL